MKKYRILSMMLAVIAVVCLFSVTAFAEGEYVAQIKETGAKFTSIQAAVNAAQSGQTVVVIKDHAIECTSTWLAVDNKITIDLNGKIITVSTKGVSSLLVVNSGGDLTLKDDSEVGTGMIDVRADVDVITDAADTNKLLTLANVYVANNGSKLTFVNGTYKVDRLKFEGAMIGAKNDELVTINGGNFNLGNVGTMLNGCPWMFNASHQDANRIYVYGGTFNADINHQHWENEVYVPKTLALNKIDESTWKVVPAVAYVDEWGRMGYPTADNFREIGYATLEEAVKSANEYTDDGLNKDRTNKITLLSDYTVDDFLTISDKIVITVDGEVEKTPTITYTGDGKMFSIDPGMSLAIDAGIYSCDVNEWCPEDYAAVKNSSGLYEVVPGYKVTYTVDEETVYVEGVAKDGYAQGYEYISGNQAVFTWKDGGDTVDFSKPITDDITLTGVLEDAYIITFDPNGSGELDPIAVRKDLENPVVAPQPENPTRSGYTFGGWYTDEALTTPYDFESNLEDNLTLYAKWNKIPTKYKVTPSADGIGASPARAKRGATVTVTIEDESIDGIKVTDSRGNLIKATRDGNKFTFKMPSRAVDIEPLVNPFDDAEKEQFYFDAMLWAVDADITEGVSATQFAPDAPCTRGQMVTFLWRAAGCPEPKSSDIEFTDVDADSFYAKAAVWAAEEEITLGTGNGRFSPDAPCSRAQMAAFLSRMADGKAKKDDSAFEDVDKDAYYADAVQWAVENGITEGVGNNKFAPDEDCTRGQMVTFLYRYFVK